MKYAALLLNAAALLLLGWTLTGVISLMGGRIPLVRPPMIELKPLVDKYVQEQADSMVALQTLNGLKIRNEKMGGAPDPSLVALPAPGTPGSEGTLMPERQLTLLAHTADESVAVVDGRLVRGGQRVSGGGRIGGIRESKVMVSEKTGRQTLAVPLESLRVGTLRAPDAQTPMLTVQVPYTASPPVQKAMGRHE